MAIGRGGAAKRWLLTHAPRRLQAHLIAVEKDIRAAVPREGSRLDAKMGDGKILDKAPARNPAMIPGRSLFGVRIGMTRAEAASVAGGRFPDFVRRPGTILRHGLRDDLWVDPSDASLKSFEILSMRGRVIQVTASVRDGGIVKTTFNDLIRQYHLQKSAFGFDEVAGGYVGYYFDNAKEGLCLAGGAQDDFLLTWLPQDLIVHRSGVATLPVSYGSQGKKATGIEAEVYVDSAAAARADKAQMQKIVPPRR